MICQETYSHVRFQQLQAITTTKNGDKNSRGHSRPSSVSQIAREQALWSGKEQKHREEVGQKEGGEPVDKPLKPPFHPLVIDLSRICHQDVIILGWMHWNINRSWKIKHFSPAFCKTLLSCGSKRVNSVQVFGVSKKKATGSPWPRSQCLNAQNFHSSQKRIFLT